MVSLRRKMYKLRDNSISSFGCPNSLNFQSKNKVDDAALVLIYFVCHLDTTKLLRLCCEDNNVKKCVRE